MGLSPYVPAVCSAVDIKARDIGLKTAPGGYVHMLPNIAGYVGADHVAMLLAIEMDEREGVTLALDIGTNTEICLNCHGKMKSVSCASGPAFEGAHIQFGMRAAKGAIERVRLSGDAAGNPDDRGRGAGRHLRLRAPRWDRPDASERRDRPFGQNAGPPACAQSQ